MPSHYGHASDIAHAARMLRRIAWCNKYEHVLALIIADEDLATWCKSGYWSKDSSPHAVIDRLVYDGFMQEAYECGMAPKHYYDDIETILPWEEAGEPINNPNPEFLAPLSSRQVLACIAYHFRADHFDNGCLLEQSVASGSLLKLMRAYREKAAAELATYSDDVLSEALLRAYRKERR